VTDATLKNPQGSGMPDWVLLEAIKRAGWTGYTLTDARHVYNGYSVTGGPCFRSLCDMILKYESPPVDRKLLCAREAVASVMSDEKNQERYREGKCDGLWWTQAALKAVTLYEEGFGK